MFAQIHRSFLWYSFALPLFRCSFIYFIFFFLSLFCVRLFPCLLLILNVPLSVCLSVPVSIFLPILSLSLFLCHFLSFSHTFSLSHFLSSSVIRFLTHSLSRSLTHSLPHPLTHSISVTISPGYTFDGCVYKRQTFFSLLSLPPLSSFRPLLFSVTPKKGLFPLNIT